jgi:hypothetical protein
VSGNEQREIVGVISQLLDYADQLSRCEQHSEMDVEALTRASEDRMAELERLMAAHRESRAGGKDGARAAMLFKENPEVFQMLKKLEAKTQRSVEAMERRRNRIEAKLSAFRHSKNAINAYHQFSK